MAYYVDTSAWIAFLTRRDTHHSAAVRTFKELAEKRAPLRSGRHTIVELLDGVSVRRGQAEAARIGQQLFENRAVRIVPSEPGFARALEIFETRTDWGVDLSDCLSFALMEALGIRRAFTYDSDFKKAGFEMIG